MNVSLDAAHAYATWVRGENDNQWVAHNQEGEKLWTFKGSVTEVEAMDAIRFCREMELRAFNIGIEYGREIERKIAEPRIERAESDARSRIAS